MTVPVRLFVFPFFFFNDTATTEIYTLSLHDALPISIRPRRRHPSGAPGCCTSWLARSAPPRSGRRSEEHTSELQSRLHLVCRLLLEKKKNNSRKGWKNRPNPSTSSWAEPSTPIRSSI